MIFAFCALALEGGGGDVGSGHSLENRKGVGQSFGPGPGPLTLPLTKMSGSADVLGLKQASHQVRNVERRIHAKNAQTDL